MYWCALCSLIPLQKWQVINIKCRLSQAPTQRDFVSRNNHKNQERVNAVSEGALSKYVMQAS
jgi:hypothetical protein